MSGAFKAEEYKNEYLERVKEAIGRKVAGKEIVQAKEGASNAAAKALYPELAHLYKCAKKRCILDGELVAFTGGKPDFYAVQRCSLMTDGFKIGIASRQKPVQFVAYDILYVGKERITDKPLLYRKEI